MQPLDSSITAGAGASSGNGVTDFAAIGDGGSGGSSGGNGNPMGDGATGGGCQNGFVIDPSSSPIFCTDNTGGNAPIATQTPGVELPDGATTINACDLVEQESLAIRVRYCAKCHGHPGIPGAPFKTILDDQPLADGGSPPLFAQTAARQIDDAGNPVQLISPGDPYGSLLYQRVSNASMPPSASAFGQPTSAMPTVSDIALLGAWIQGLPGCLGGGAGGGSGGGGDGGADGGGGAGGSSSGSSGGDGGSDSGRNSGSSGSSGGGSSGGSGGRVRDAGRG